MTLPQVLLVEDDASVRRFVDAALEDLGIELHMTSGIADAVAQLKCATFALVLTDLMLAGESGRTLVRQLGEDASLGGGPRVAVYSAGLTQEVSAELSQLGAWRLLHKPVSVEQLRQCVRDAISAAPEHSGGKKRAEPTGEATAPSVAVSVVETYFGGNERIYLAYREACEQQYPADILDGDKAFAAQDATAMRRLGHSLKSVLLALGHVQAADMAKAIDVASVKGDWAIVQQQWPALRAALESLIQAGQIRTH